MELYVVTQSGKEAIPMLKRVGHRVEASILEYLGMAEGATVEQVAKFTNLDEKIIYDKLRTLSSNRWVWRKMTRLVEF